MAKLKWYGQKAKALARQAAKQALQICAADLQGKSAMQAPIDTGDLRANCFVSPVQVENTEIYVEVGYDLPYAMVQHERLDFNHPKGGKAKYLADPYNENKAKYEKLIDHQVRKALKRG